MEKAHCRHCSFSDYSVGHQQMALHAKVCKSPTKSGQSQGGAIPRLTEQGNNSEVAKIREFKASYRVSHLVADQVGLT